MVDIKKMVVITTLLFIANSMQAQSDTVGIDEGIIFSIESMPQYPGGEVQLLKFIESHINNELISESTINGTVYVSCWVDTLGYTWDHKVIRGLSVDLDNEALRVSRLIKFEKPAMQRGKPIKIKYTVPVKFVLPRQDRFQKNGCKK